MQRRILNVKNLVILFIFCIFALCSCTTKYDAIKFAESKFPNSEIYQIYGTDKLVVINNDGIYVVSLNPVLDNHIINLQLIKKWQNQ